MPQGWFERWILLRRKARRVTLEEAAVKLGAASRRAEEQAILDLFNGPGAA
jgi:hypothetical protein